MNTSDFHQKHRRKKHRLVLSTLLVVAAIASFTVGALSGESPGIIANAATPTIDASPPPTAVIFTPSPSAPPERRTSTPADTTKTATAIIGADTNTGSPTSDPHETPSDDKQPAINATSATETPVAELPPQKTNADDTDAPSGDTDGNASAALDTSDTVSSTAQADADADDAAAERAGDRASATPDASDTVSSTAQADADAADATFNGNDEPDASATEISASTEKESSAAIPSSQSDASPTQTTSQDKLSPEQPQPDGSNALLPATGQKSQAKRGSSPGNRYFAIGFILLLLAGGVLASPEDRTSSPGK